MNKDLKIARKTVQTEIEGLKKLLKSFQHSTQFSTGKNDAYIIQPDRKHYKAPNIVKILENNKITKIGHYLRYDVSGLEYFLKCNVLNIFDT